MKKLNKGINKEDLTTVEYAVAGSIVALDVATSAINAMVAVAPQSWCSSSKRL